MTGNSNDKVNFTHKFLLTNRQVSSLCKAFAKYLSANITILKTQFSKIIQSGGFIGRLPGPLMAINFSLIKNLLTPLAKRVFISLVLTAASAAEAGIHKNIFRSRDPRNDGLGSGTTLLILNEETEAIMKIVEPPLRFWFTD